MKKTFLFFTAFTFLLFNVFSIQLSAQCSGLVTQAGPSNANVNLATVGQSWIADCTGTVDAITVTSNSAASNVTLRVYSGNLLLLTIGTLYTQTGISLAAGVPTTINLTTPVPIVNSGNYLFTLSAASGNLDLQAVSPGTFATGFAAQSVLNVEITNLNIALVVPLATSDLTFNIVATSAVLPVELTSFKASKLGNQSQLDWTTAYESDNQHFTIERSKDAKNFKQIGIVNSKGASYENQDYTFIDPSPAKGYNYYRLKQVNFDGKYDYSKVEMVTLKGYAEVMLYPNPAKESITLETFATDKHEVKIMDYMGRVWLSKTLENEINQLNIASLPKGLYFLESYIDNELVRKKIVKE